MSLSPIIFYFVVLILFDRAVKSQVSSNSNSNAFIQGNNDVRYIVDNIPITVHQEFSGNPGVKVHNVEESSNSQFHLKFDPPLLDFKERPLGVPHHEKVTVVNLNGNKTVHMSSISGHTVHFHSSFFEDKVVVPLGNTSFNVVFLGREAGEVESNLFIHTSEGSFKYQVRGCSVQSPYRLRPLSGVRLPLNASFSPLIHMHNPYATPLQLVEVYSSGGEFHLELPSGELEGPKHLWEIPAFRTKPIIRVRFHARAQKNHTAYIRLKVNQSEEVLVVPLEVEVGPVCGLYSPEDVIDFGIGGSHDPPTTRKLWLHNSWKKPIKIQNIISTPVSKAFRIDFEPVKVPPETDEPTQVAQLTFDWRTALESGHTAGRIVVKSKQSAQKLVIPYTATVLSGGLSYDRDITRFRSDSEDIPPRTFHLVNNFKLPIAITNVSLSVEARPYFKLRHFEPRILLSGQSVPLLEIVPTVPPHLVLDSALVIVTNVSTLNVPLLCYDGKLTKVISHRNESELELGTVGSGTEKQFVFALVNENPVPVTILSLETDLPSAAVSVAAVCSGSALSLLSHYSLHNDSTTERLVGPGQMAVVRLLLRTGAQVGEASALVRLRTEYESVELPVHVRVEHGSLLVTPDPVTFTNCFPSTVCLEVLRVQSLFSVAMAVTGVSAVPGDPRLSFSPVTPPLLLPASTTELGTLSFDTELLPPEENYLATTPNNTGSTRWQDTLELPAHTLDHDLSLLVTRYEHYRNLSSRLLNLTLRLDTTEVRDHMFTARVRLSWPVLSADLSFPLTQVGNMSERSLVISNPGTRLPVLVQLVLEAAYPQAQSLLEGLPLELRPVELEDAQLPAGEFVIDASESSHLLAEMLHHRDSWLFLVPPRSNTTVRVKFSPASAHLSSTLLLLRNNLTVLEAVTLSGSGAFTQFKFGNRKPGSSTPLLFELAEKHLKDCEREKQRRFPAPNLTVKRSFTARNTGALPIAVHGFHISGLSCEGYGFRVLNCEAFNLPPNGTRKVDIAFTPDFTLARVQRTLGVWTSESDSVANYTLVATLPPYLLSSCSQVLARPAWEPLLYYCAVTFMVFLLVCVLAAAFLESDRALKCALLAMSRDTATVQPVLDLKSIGTGVGLGCSSGALSQGPDKTETPPPVSWTRPTPAPTPSAVAVQEPTEPTAVKENVLKPETDVSGIFTSPATKCAKKKEKEKTAVSKRYSDPTDERHSSWAMFTKPAPGSLAKPHVKPTLPADTKRKLTKKTSNNTVSLREVMPLLPATNNSEDTETSSTTTESSHDDGDKEVEVASTHKCHKTRGSGKPQMSEGRKVTVAGGSASSLELEWEDEDLNDREATIKKPNASTSSRNRKTASKSAKVEGSQSSRGKTSSGLGKQPSIRAKDKQTLTQKRSADKLTTQPKPVVFEPPPPPLTLWDDSRASFSDVVARSDTSKHVEQSTLSLSPLQTTTPAAAATTVTTSGPAALGPIGSKKSYPSGWDCWSDSVSLTPATPVAGPAVTGLAMPSPAASTNSFFMDSFSDARSNPVMQSSGYDGWKDHALLLKLLQAEEQRRLEAEELQRSRPVYQDTWSPWSGSAPVAEPAPVPAPPGLWGSDVWAPPPPDTWAPPGLAPRPPPRLDDPINPDLDVGLDYDPFRSLSNIWAPHTPTTFWKPPTTSN